jgi:hypothetical protein
MYPIARITKTFATALADAIMTVITAFMVVVSYDEHVTSGRFVGGRGSWVDRLRVTSRTVLRKTECAGTTTEPTTNGRRTRSHGNIA